MDLTLGNDHHANGYIRLFMAMVGDHGIKIHLVDVISRQNHHLLRRSSSNEINVMANGICGSFVPVGILFTGARRQNLDAAGSSAEIPGLACADMTHQ